MNKDKSGKFAGQCRPDSKDRKLWQAYTRDITPLDPGRGNPDAPLPPVSRDAEAGAGKRQDPDHKRATAPAASAGHGNKHGQQGTTASLQLDRRTDDRLRRGKLPIEAQLDLHGMTRDKARHILTQFLSNSYASGKRCVLVITGKGTLGADIAGDGCNITEPGVLRRSVPEWLATPPLSDMVIRHYPARARDGGNGALYILLRRRRG